MKNLLIFLTFLCGLMLVLYLFAPYFSGSDVLISIPQGANAEEVARTLKKNKLILSENFFLLLARIKKIENLLKAGTYRLSPQMTSGEILKSMVLGKTYAVKVTIPEGYNAREIASLLASRELVRPEKFIQLVEEKKLEGYLYPETYYLGPGMSEKKIIETFTKQFNSVFTPAMEERAKEMKLSREKIVILASIIEKETNKDEERKLVSAVFHNRLKKGWALESCATVKYTWEKNFDAKKTKLSYEDLEIDSPYNTYRNSGLPPGPISNPGLAAINAALYPEDTDLMFFVADGEGTHKFSRYYQEHLSAKSKKKKKKNK